jgi:hypothetical protein
MYQAALLLLSILASHSCTEEFLFGNYLNFCIRPILVSCLISLRPCVKRFIFFLFYHLQYFYKLLQQLSCLLVLLHQKRAMVFFE